MFVIQEDQINELLRGRYSIPAEVRIDDYKIHIVIDNQFATSLPQVSVNTTALNKAVARILKEDIPVFGLVTVVDELYRQKDVDHDELITIIDDLVHFYFVAKFGKGIK